MKTLSRLLFAFLVLATFGGSALGGAARAADLPTAAPSADIRVLIDVSGSMKKNDPHNLRRPALDLLVRLFPADARAGVWSFGHDVAVMVPHGNVDGRWREAGRRQAQRIHSNALHTDIPAALAAALADAEALDAARRTSVILLTDGMVDVSKSAEVNAAARQRLIDEVAPRLRQLGVHVHTVALSDEADHELLEQLAVITDGLSAVANDAEELKRIFVQALDAAAPSEQLPLTNNRFLVDSSVDELTALVFHEGAPMVMVSPDGARHTAVEHGTDFAWHRGDGYELVTVTRPYEGEWRLEGDVDSGSRVTIVSDLSLAATRLPDNLFPGEPPAVSALLREEGEPLNRPELLALVEFSAEVTRLSEAQRPPEAWRVDLLAEGDAFAATLPMLVAEPGQYELRVVADGKTFQRSLKQRITVRDHFELQVSATDEIPARQQLLVRALNPNVALDSAVASATLQTGSDEPRQMSPTRSADGRSWELILEETTARREINWEIAFQLPGDSAAGNAAVWRSGAVVLDGGKVERAPVPPLQLTTPVTAEVVPDQPENAAPPEATSEPATAEAEAEAEAEPETKRSWLLYAGLAVGNLLLIALAVVAYRKIMGVPVKADATGSDDEADTVAATSGEQSAVPPLDSLDLPLDAIDLDPASEKS